MTFSLKVTLLSDASFASGKGSHGFLDNDVESDDQGFPQIGSRRLAGLLAEEGRELLTAMPQPAESTWTEVHEAVFGKPSSSLVGHGAVAIGTARMPSSVRTALLSQSTSADAILEACTAIRRQTVIDPVTGSPAPRLLRATRVVVRDLWFISQVDLASTGQEAAQHRAWLATCVSTLRRGGLRRNRGRGRMNCALWQDGKDRTIEWRGPVIRALDAGAF